MTAFLAGLHYWWPKLTGRMYNNFAGRASGMLYMIGLNLAFFPQIILGAKGVPAGVYTPDPALSTLYSISGVGMVVLAVALVMIVWNLVGSMVSGPAAGSNPWGATTLEWQAASPPVDENFAEAPAAGEPYRF